MTKNQYELDVKVIREMFYSEDSMFGIYSCKPSVYVKELLNKYGNMSLQGNTRRLTVGDTYKIKFDGSYTHPKYGNFYKINEVEPEKLNTIEQQDRFLKAILNTGHFNSLKTAYPNSLLVDLICEDKVDVSKTKGIKEKTMAKIKEEVKSQAGVSVLISMLSELNLSTNKIQRIMAHYGNAEKAMVSIKDNIYSLCEIPTFGFKTVDDCALERGDNPTNKNRIYACIDYLLKEDNQHGHTWTPVDELVKKAIAILDINPDLIYTSVESMKTNHKYYMDETRVAFNRLLKKESEVYNQLKRIESSYTPPSIDNVEVILKEVEEKQGFDFTSEQRDVIVSSLDEGVSVINGFGGTGKCIKSDSLVYTSKGLMKIEDVPNHFKVNKDQTSSAGIVSYDLKGKALKKKTSHFFDMGISKTIKIKTNQGYEIEGTPEHPIMIINEDGDLKYKKLEDFNGKEVIPISTNNGIFGKDKTINKDISYLMGVVVGDGGTSKIGFEKGKVKYGVRITNSSKEIGEEYVRIALDEFNLKTHKAIVNNTFTYSFGSKEITSKLVKEYDLPACLSKDKYIPSTVMKSPRGIVSSFLKGLFDTDASMYGGMFEYSTASRRLAKEVHAMLLNFGIVSNLREKKVKGYEENTYYIITISNRFYLKIFQEEIGFYMEMSKKKKLNDIVNSSRRTNSNIDILTNMNKKLVDIHTHFLFGVLEGYNKKGKYYIPLEDGELCSIRHAKDNRLGANGYRKSVYSKTINKLVRKYPDVPHAEFLRNITDNMFIDYVSSIEESEAHVYDFTVPDTHSFVANGFVNHNTTIVKGLIESIGSNSFTCATLSGKAANVLRKNGLDASTIHRMLKWDIKSNSFTYDEDNKLPHEILVLDEFSMNSVDLILHVLRAVKDGTKVIIIGDSGQLPSIGSGSGDVLRDLLETKVFPTYELTQVHRQASKSGILQLANSIRRGELIMPYGSTGTEVYGELNDQTVISYPDKDQIADDIVRISQSYKSKIKRPSDIFDFQVIVPNREKGSLSVRSLNSRLQPVFNNTDKPSISRNGYDYREGDKIMCNNNSYNQPCFEDEFEFYDFNAMSANEQDSSDVARVDIFNGTLGYILDVNVDEKVIMIQYEGVDGLVVITQEDADTIDLAYASTCHKMQGSGIKHTITAVSYESFMLLSKQLLYTAVSRTVEKGLLLGEAKALHTAVSTDVSKLRRTFLADIIRENLNKNGDI